MFFPFHEIIIYEKGKKTKGKKTKGKVKKGKERKDSGIE
jgi:hypothetical protein